MKTEFTAQEKQDINFQILRSAVEAHAVCMSNNTTPQARQASAERVVEAAQDYIRAKEA